MAILDICDLYFIFGTDFILDRFMSDKSKLFKFFFIYSKQNEVSIN